MGNRRLGVAGVCAAITLAAVGCDDGTGTTGGSPVTPSATFAPPADIATVKRIDEAEAGFYAKSGESYSYLLTYHDDGKELAECGFGNSRIVVEDGEITDAVGMPTDQRPGCHLDPGDVPSVAELFDAARSVAGAEEFSISTSPSYNLIQVRAIDADFNFGFVMADLSHSVGPTSVGWDEVPAAADAARARWEQQSFDYTVSITWLNFLLGNTTRTTTVIDGEIVAATENDEAVDPSTLSGPWPPFTVDDLFDIIGEEAQRKEGTVWVVFEPDTGLPSSLHTNSDPQIADDEIDMFATIERL